MLELDEELLEEELDELELLELEERPDELELDELELDELELDELELLDELEELLLEEPPVQRLAVALRPAAVLCSSK